MPRHYFVKTTDYALTISHLPWRKHFVPYAQGRVGLTESEAQNTFAYVCSTPACRSDFNVYTVHVVFGRQVRSILGEAAHIHEAHHAADRLTRTVFRKLYPGVSRNELRAETTARLSQYYRNCLLGDPSNTTPLEELYAYLDYETKVRP